MRQLLPNSNRLRRFALPLVLSACALWAVRCNVSGDSPLTPSGGGSTPSSTECPPVAVCDGSASGPEDPVVTFARTQLEEGRKTFRYDTFGDEDFWGGTLQMHKVILGADRGGVGTGISPKAALGVGLKIDSEALPADVVEALKTGKLDLDSVDVTLAALKANAVVGVTGFFEKDKLTSFGLQCAFCHSTVDDSITAGIGRRLDGWPNRDLDVGGIISLSPNLAAVAGVLKVTEDTVRQVLAGWGKGKFDAEVFFDQRATRPDGKSGATLIPAAFGLAGVNLHTYTGWGSVPQWNALVANLEMHGKGVYFDPRLDDAKKFPLAAEAKLGHTTSPVDRVTPKLAALHMYQLAIDAPKPPPSSFDATAAGRGKAVFEGPARCASCHVPPLFTEPGWNMHTPAEIGIDDFQASRSPDGRYRTTPLRGLFARAKGGFYHDGRFPTLEAVIDHYDGFLELHLTSAQKADLLHYLKSL